MIKGVITLSDHGPDIIDLERQIRLHLRLAYGLILCGGAIALWAIFWFSLTPDDLDHLGSFLGGTVVGLWTLAGILLVYIAFLGQRRQIGNQEVEIHQNRLVLEATRLELAGQREQMELQNAIFRAQSFESTFFHLMSLQHQIVSEIAVVRAHGTRSGTYRGREAFEELYRDFKAQYSPSTHGPASSQEQQLINRTYLGFYVKHQATFGHYFRNLYRIIRWVDQMSGVDKIEYAKFARAQLSSYELACLFYNCLSDAGALKFKPLIERYALLKNLPDGLLLHADHASHYAANAFGTRQVPLPGHSTESSSAPTIAPE